jgi:hypothetical protein
LIAALAEHEVAERDRRRIERHLGEARLPTDKTLDSFAFDAVPMISRAQVTAMPAKRSLLGSTITTPGDRNPRAYTLPRRPSLPTSKSKGQIGSA